MPPAGLRGSRVEMVEWEELAAAASPLPQALPEPVTASDLAEHASVALWLLEQGATVLPFRCGVSAPSREQVVELLRRNGPQLRQQLQRLKGTVEAALVGFWEKAALRRAVLRQPQARRALAAAHRVPAWWGLADIPPPPREAALELGALTESVVQRWRERFTAMACQAVKEVALEVRSHRVLGVRMLFNLAIWIPEDRKGALQRIVEGLQEAWRGSVRMRLTAPLPPFSFTDLVLQSPVPGTSA